MTTKKTTTKKTTKKSTAAKVPTKSAVTKPKATAKKAAAKKATTKKAAQKSPATKTPAKSPARVISPEERYMMIQTAAYFLAEKQHFQADPADIWVQAEQEVDARLNTQN